MECPPRSVLGSYLLSTLCPAVCEWAQCLFCYRAFLNSDVEDVEGIHYLHLEHQCLQHLPSARLWGRARWEYVGCLFWERQG